MSEDQHHDDSHYFWRKNGARYYSLGVYYKRLFGAPVRKVSVDAHFSCPNIDGTVGRGGCVFCNATSFSPSRRFGLEELNAQIDDGVKRLRYRFGESKYIAYFQPSTNTHAPVETLRRVYEAAIQREDIVGVAIGTRPDALPEEVLTLLQEISARTYLSLELGLQSTHDKSLQWMNRGCDYATFLDAVARCHAHGLRVGAHLILGLPTETREDLLVTAERVAALGLESVKLHNLYVVKGTRLAQMWRDNEFTLPTLQEYAQMVVDFLERLDPQTVVERVCGEATEDYLLAPAWCAQKHAGLNAVAEAFARRRSYQGRLFQKKSE
ncbi:MAG: TIGR01212 family radical SAM protein [Planctomycetia bacterium]|nr:TIGR01212 family radical SAM protein [Planctomycetia bacterium]